MSSKGDNVVDLTDDNDPIFPSSSSSQPLTQQNRRVLPLSFTKNGVAAGKSSSSSVGSRDAYSRNMEVRTSQVKVPVLLTRQAPVNSVHPSSLSSNSQPAYAPAYTPLLRVTFKLINIREFTARVEKGKISFDIIQLLTQTPGAKFDWPKQRWVFPIAVHDSLSVALNRCKCNVESIPRHVLIAAQFSSQNTPAPVPIVIDLLDEEPESSTNKAQSNTELPSITTSLLPRIPLEVLKHLTPFQQEAVQFVLQREGRGLVGDEMGLGKTRTALGCMAAYMSEWPVLVVCPSSARHHWVGEIDVVFGRNHTMDEGGKEAEESGGNSEIGDGSDNFSDEENKDEDEGRDSTIGETRGRGRDKGRITENGVLLLESSATCQTFQKEIRKALEDCDERRNSQKAVVDIRGENEGAELVEGVVDPGEGGKARSKSTEDSIGADSIPLKFVILSYSLLPTLQSILRNSRFNCIIVDESHCIKSRSAKRTQVLMPMLHRAQRVVLLSGTPALSRPVELFTQLHALQPKQWPDYKAYAQRYCVDKRSKSSWGKNVFNGANNLQELHILLTSGVMIRRLKRDIYSHLPPKRRYVVQVKVEDENTRQQLETMVKQVLSMQEKRGERKQRKARKQVKEVESDEKTGDEGKDESKETSGGSIDKAGDLNNFYGDVEDLPTPQAEKNLLMQLFQRSGLAKLPNVLKHLEDFLQHRHTGKVLVFAHHVEVLKAVGKFVKDLDVEYIYIDGSTNSAERYKRTQTFQKNPAVRVAVLSITAAGVALTLTAASVVYFAEMYWTPASLLQAEDRAHRIGQLNTVHAYYFHASNTVDTLLWPMIKKKMHTIGEAVEGVGVNMEVVQGSGDDNDDDTNGGSGKRKKRKLESIVEENERKSSGCDGDAMARDDGDDNDSHTTMGEGEVNKEGEEGQGVKLDGAEAEGGFGLELEQEVLVANPYADIGVGEEGGLGVEAVEAGDSMQFGEVEGIAGDEMEEERGDEGDEENGCKKEEVEGQEDTLERLAEELAKEDKQKTGEKENSEGEDGDVGDQSENENKKVESYLRSEDRPDKLARVYMYIFPQLDAYREAWRREKQLALANSQALLQAQTQVQPKYSQVQPSSNYSFPYQPSQYQAQASKLYNNSIGGTTAPYYPPHPHPYNHPPPNTQPFPRGNPPPSYNVQGPPLLTPQICGAGLPIFPASPDNVHYQPASANSTSAPIAASSFNSQPALPSIHTFMKSLDGNAQIAGAIVPSEAFAQADSVPSASIPNPNNDNPAPLIPADNRATQQQATVPSLPPAKKATKVIELDDDDEFVFGAGGRAVASNGKKSRQEGVIDLLSDDEG